MKRMNFMSQPTRFLPLQPIQLLRTFLLRHLPFVLFEFNTFKQCLSFLLLICIALLIYFAHGFKFSSRMNVLCFHITIDLFYVFIYFLNFVDDGLFVVWHLSLISCGGLVLLLLPYWVVNFICFQLLKDFWTLNFIGARCIEHFLALMLTPAFSLGLLWRCLFH